MFGGRRSANHPTTVRLSRLLLLLLLLTHSVIVAGSFNYPTLELEIVQLHDFFLSFGYSIFILDTCVLLYVYIPPCIRIWGMKFYVCAIPVFACFTT